MKSKDTETCQFVIYVVTTRHHHQRHESIRQQFQNYNLAYQFIEEFDADMISKSDLRKIDPDKLSKTNSISAVLKHMKGQILLLEEPDEVKYALIVEDDLILYPNFKKRLTTVIEATTTRRLQEFLIFIGGGDNKRDISSFFKDSNEILEGSITTAEAYIVDRLSAAKRTAWIKNNKINAPADHFLKSLDEILGVNTFIIASPLATQGSITGLFDSTLDDYRQRKNKTFLLAKYLVRRTFRHVIPRMFSSIIIYLTWNKLFRNSEAKNKHR